MKPAIRLIIPFDVFFDIYKHIRPVRNLKRYLNMILADNQLNLHSNLFSLS